MLIFLSLIFAIGLTIIHFASKYMKFLSFMPRSRFLSLAGGISVSYVFIDVLPQLSKHQEKLNESGIVRAIGFLENHIYLMAMLGLALFYGLEMMARRSRKKRNVANPNAVFWVHIGSFSIYNALIGYLLIRGESDSLLGMSLYFLALALHFISNDHGLRESHQEIYDRYGRWLLSVSILAGWAAGFFTEVSEQAIGALFALLAGSIVFNVLKEELPEDRHSNFWAFAAGLVGYTVLLLLIT